MRWSMRHLAMARQNLARRGAWLTCRDSNLAVPLPLHCYRAIRFGDGCAALLPGDAVNGRTQHADAGGLVEALQIDIGPLIRELRTSRGITVTELARRAGISQPYLTQIERGLRPVTRDVLSRLADGLTSCRA